MPKRGIGLVLYGGEGLGKTSFAVQWAALGSVKVISINEIGYDSLNMVGDVPENCTNIKVNNFEDLHQAVVSTTEDTLVLDSVGGIQEKIFDYVCRTQFEGNFEEFMSYHKGPRSNSPPVFGKFLELLDRHLQAGRHVIVIGHMITTTVPNTSGADYLSHVLALDDGEKDGMRQRLMRWSPNVLFLNIEVAITRSTERGVGNEKGIVLEGKADDRDNRFFYTTKAPGHAAKNTLKLPPVIPAGHSAQEAFNNFIAKLPAVLRDSL